MNNVEIQKIEERVLPLPDRAKALTVTDSERLEKARDFLVTIKRMKAEVDKAFDPIIKKAPEAHKEALAQKKRYLDPLDAAERLLKPKISAYLMNLEEERREAERKERERLEAQKRAEEEQIQKAIEAEEKGDLEEAEKILDQEPAKLDPVAIPQKPILSQVHTVTNWKFRVKDPEAIPREYLKIDEVKIGKVVRILKDKTDIPGIEAYPETSVATRVS